jgi:hypothetical protein
MAGPGEVQDPRVKALLLGGGAAVAGAPFVASAMGLGQKPKRQPRPKPNRLAQATPTAGRGILSTLGRAAGPAGAIAGMVVPSGNMAGPEATMLRPNETYSDPVLQRTMFSGQTPNADGQGITSGLDTSPEQEAQMEEVMGDMSGMMQSMADGIDNASDYVGIMNAIRGDDQSIDQRRGELAQLIGKSDAEKTPESALTLIQPSLTLLEATDQGSPDAPEPIVDEGILSALGKAGEQGEAMARMEMGEQPVMRSDGTPQTAAGGETAFPSGMNLSTLQTLQGLIPEPTTYAQNLKYYQDVLGSDKTGYELNPYISGLQLAAAVANAPKGELVSSILAPETIKAVSDPILQMAQAKSKTDQAVKLKAAEATAASKTASTKAESDLLLKIAPELLKVPDLKTFGNTELGFYAVDPRKPDTPIQMKPGLGRKKDVFGNQVTGYGYLDDNNTYVEVDPGTGVKPDIFGNAEVGYFYLDDKKTVKTAKTGSGKPNQIFGNATTGYFAFDPNTKSATKIEGAEGTGVQPPEFITLMDRFNTASAIVNNETASNADKAKAKNEMMFLTDKLTTKDPEFTELMNTKAQMVFDSTEGTTAEKTAAKDAYIASTIDSFITGKTTITTQYNPNEALDKEFAGLYSKQVDEIRKSTDNANQLATLSEIANVAAENFQTGKFAKTRLEINKLMQSFGITDAVRDAIGQEKFDALIDPQNNDIASGEVLQQVSSQFAIRMAESFPGNLNQSEVQLIIDAAPNLLRTKAGLDLTNKIFNDANTRAVAESQYATDFMNDPANAQLTPEAKYAKFNEGLRSERAANPLITPELVSELTSASAAADAVPDGGMRVVLSDAAGGGTDVLDAAQTDVWNRAQNLSLADFQAAWPSITTQYPQFDDRDAAGTYNMLRSMGRSN